MKPPQRGAANLLKEFNDWRRGAETEQPDPTDVGLAIDTVLADYERQDKCISEIENHIERWRMGRTDDGDALLHIQRVIVSLGLLSFWNDKKP